MKLEEVLLDENLALNPDLQAAYKSGGWVGAKKHLENTINRVEQPRHMRAVLMGDVDLPNGVRLLDVLPPAV